MTALAGGGRCIWFAGWRRGGGAPKTEGYCREHSQPGSPQATGAAMRVHADTKRPGLFRYLFFSASIAQ